MFIHVLNLSPLTSREELMDCFQNFGPVSDASICTYMIGGSFRATGFVEMPSNIQGKAAIKALQGQELDGKLLEIRRE